MRILQNNELLQVAGGTGAPAGGSTGAPAAASTGAPAAGTSGGGCTIMDGITNGATAGINNANMSPAQGPNVGLAAIAGAVEGMIMAMMGDCDTQYTGGDTASD